MSQNGQASPRPGAAPVWIEKVHFGDGTPLTLEPGHVVVIVGPNNVGKSQTLRNLDEALTNRRHGGHQIVSRIELAFAGDQPKEAVASWIEEHVPRLRPRNGPTTFSRGGAAIPESQLEQQLEKRLRPPRLDLFGNMMTLTANAEERLRLATKSKPVDVSGTAPTSPVQALYNRSREIRAVSDSCKEAFGHPITYDHIGDGLWRLRLGELPEVNVDRHGFPSEQVRNRIRDMPSVDEQGDGLRSYVGLLAEFLSSSHLFVLLDEPEAFLHPPQARLLGRHIVELKSQSSQVVVATHDANFLRGVMDAASGSPVSIVRLRRSGSRTTAHVLEPASLDRMWKDPVLRYSNVLEGLFHHGVVVCEADPDCRLYESVIQAHGLARSGTDFMFTQSGGVERVHAIVEALQAIAVPTQIIIDADSAAKQQVLQRIVVALGFEWSEDLAHGQARLAAHCSDKGNAPRVRDIQHVVAEALSGLDLDAELEPTTIATLRRALKSRTGWEEFKRFGLSSLRGDASALAREFLKSLSHRGLHLVPVGELESWFPEAPGKGTKHVRHVHEKGWHEDDARCRGVIEFLGQVVEGFSVE